MDKKSISRQTLHEMFLLKLRTRHLRECFVLRKEDVFVKALLYTEVPKKKLHVVCYIQEIEKT